MLKNGEEVSGYIVEGHLARGASADVYLVHRKGSPTQQAALKVLFQTSSQERTRFEQENAILWDLDSHGSIATPHTHLEAHPDGPCYIMEYFPVCFTDLGAAPHTLDARTRLATAIRIAEGIGHAHSKGYVHRDLHTGNVMFAGGSQTGYGAKITDFGRALNHNNLLRLSGPNNPGWGQLFFMPPEVSFKTIENDDQTATRLCDIYSVGLLTYNLFMTQHSFFWNGLMSAITSYWYNNNLPYDLIRYRLTDATFILDRRLHHSRWLNSMSTPQLTNLLRVNIAGDASLASGITSIITKAADPNPANRFQTINDMLDAMRQL